MKNDRNKSLATLQHKFSDLLKIEAEQADVKSGTNANEQLLEAKQRMKLEHELAIRKVIRGFVEEIFIDLCGLGYNGDDEESTLRPYMRKLMNDVKYKLPDEGYDSAKVKNLRTQVYVGLFGSVKVYIQKMSGKSSILDCMCSRLLLYALISRLVLNLSIDHRHENDNSGEYKHAGSLVRKYAISCGAKDPRDLDLSKSQVSRDIKKPNDQLSLPFDQ